MDKQTFLSSVDASRSSAESAWELADGDEDKAKSLLSPEKIKIKGRFSDQEEGFYGLFSIVWDLNTSDFIELQQAVSSDNDVQDVSPSDSIRKFNGELEDFRTGNASMGGFTEQFKNNLQSALNNTSSSIYKAIDNQNSDQMEDSFSDLLEEHLELKSASVLIDSEIERAIDNKSTEKKKTSSESSSDKSSENKSLLPCKVQINPVKGVPVTNIEPGNDIFIELTQSAEEKDYSTVRELRKVENSDGLIPARVTSKRSTDAGKLRIKVDIAGVANGTISCSEDVSILVPDTGSSKESNDFEPLELLTNEVFMGLAFTVLAIIVLGIWLFL